MQGDLQSKLAKLVEDRPRADRNTATLDPQCQAALALHWDILVQEATRLHLQQQKQDDDGNLERAREQLRVCLAWAKHSPLFQGLRGASAVSSSNKRSGISELRLGLGSPGYNGCLAVSAEKIRWEVLTDDQWWVLAAMRHLGLHLVAMPGARLAPGAAIPGMKDVRIAARGGPGYGSTAFIWRASILGDSITEVVGVGSDRRLPMCVSSEQGPLWIELIYMHPLQSTSREEWNHELEGLGKDLAVLRSRTPSTSEFHLLLVGDINVEPAELGGCDAQGTNRRRRWSLFLEANKLSMRSPASNSQETEEVYLPIRGRTILLGSGSTHHCQGKARAIDVVASTVNNEVDVSVHNGLHCRRDGGVHGLYASNIRKVTTSWCKQA